MGNATINAAEYWEYLIQPDKTPAPLFEQLLLGIANYIKNHVAPWHVDCLTPTKLAAFYRLVGGDFDSLFLETPPPSLSFIYQSLGCFHTLQPDQDPFIPPSTPALTPQGFVRWQTVQLLLGPDEHVPLLQKAVKSFEIINPVEGGDFPKILPKTAFPSKPDTEMVKWHEGVSDRLRLDAEAFTPRRVPEATDRGEYDKDVDVSATQSSIEQQSVVDGAEYFAEPRFRPPFVRPDIGIIHVPSPPCQHPQQRQQWHAPGGHHQYRRRSLPDSNQKRSPYWSNEAPAPTSSAIPHIRPRSRPRTPSTLSTTSDSDSDDESNVTTSEASRSPGVRHQDHPELCPPSSGQERRHSANSPYDPRDHKPPQQSGAIRRPLQQYFDQEQLASGAPRGNARGLNVRWHDINHMWDLPGSAPTTPSVHHSGRSAEGRRGASGVHSRSRTVGGPLRGVGGRQYPVL